MMAIIEFALPRPARRSPARLASHQSNRITFLLVSRRHFHIVSRRNCLALFSSPRSQRRQSSPHLIVLTQFHRLQLWPARCCRTAPRRLRAGRPGSAALALDHASRARARSTNTRGGRANLQLGRQRAGALEPHSKPAPDIQRAEVGSLFSRPLSSALWRALKLAAC